MSRQQPEETAGTASAAVAAGDPGEPGGSPTDQVDPSAPGDPAAPGAPAVRPGVPDLLGLSLEEIRTLDHPVLADLLGELRERAGRPAETLWGFGQGPS